LNGNDVNFATKDFVTFLRARIALYSGNYDAAVGFANTLIGKYPLADQDQYLAMFNGDSNTTEVVFKFDLGSIRFKFREDLLFTRKIILQRLNNLERPDNPTYLLLDRSDNHSYYTTKGETYGKARRGLLNLEEGFNDLIKKGVPVNIIQPGSHSILYQIEAFNQSKGVIGIRGAEFANLIWLEPGSKVVVLSKAILIPHLRNYAALLGLKLVVKGRDTDYPNMLDYNFKEILRK
jgi:hypothetical protein